MSDIESIDYMIVENPDVLDQPQQTLNRPQQTISPVVSEIPGLSTPNERSSANRRGRNRRDVMRKDFTLDEKTKVMNRFTRGTFRLFAKIERYMYLPVLTADEKADVLRFFELLKSSCCKESVSQKGEAEYAVKAVHAVRCSKRHHRLQAWVEFEGYPEKEWVLIDTIGNLGALNDYFKNFPASSALKRALGPHGHGIYEFINIVISSFVRQLFNN